MATADAMQPEWNPLPRMRTHELVIAEIEDRLTRGSLAAGDRLPAERLLAESLGVSRGAVREALRILEAIGVIEVGTGSGRSAGSVLVNQASTGMAMVLRMHLRLAHFGVTDLVEVRDSLAELAAYRAAERATEEDIAALRSLVECMRAAGDRNSFLAADREIGERLSAISGNALVSIVSAELWRAVDGEPAGGADVRDEPAAMRALIEERAAAVEALVDAIAEAVAEAVVEATASGDGARAARATVAHDQLDGPSGEFNGWRRAG